MVHWVREVMGFPVSLEIVEEREPSTSCLPSTKAHSARDGHETDREAAVSECDSASECEVTAADREAVVEKAYAELLHADEIFSPFRPQSELSRLDRGQLRGADASPEMREVLKLAQIFETASDGVFSIWRAGHLDANGIVKGWAVQRAANILMEAGINRFCLNAGGDVVVRGRPDPQAGGGVQAWHIGVRSPWEAQRMVAVLALSNQACATSGLYERGSHITNAREGTVASHWASVTVVAENLTVADVLATTVFAMEEAGPEWAWRTFGVAVLAVRSDASLVIAGPLPLARGTN